MAVHHQPHLLDFSTPPPAFDNNGLLTLHPVAGADMSATSGGGVLITGDTTPPPWPQAAVSPLSLQFNYNHHRQPFTAAAPPAVALSVAPHHELQVPAAAGSLQQPFHLILRSSKYLGPVKELLGEFCSLEVEGEFHATVDKRDSRKAAAGNKWDDAEAAVSSSWLWGSPSSISSMDLFEFERRKARLMSMVQEVDRRYRRYREQMRSVELSFEAVTGAGAAQVYTRLARRAMSRHFRCLRDALVAQVRALKKAMGDRDGGVAPAGATKGDTPRLRVLDQCLRQRRAFQQPAGATESCPWRPQRGLPERAVAVLRAWLFEHFLHPYPNDVDKHILSRQTGLSRSQVSNWFINARVRLWKPMIEDMYKEEMNLQQNPSDDTAAAIVKAERCTATMDLGGGGGGGSYQHQQQPFIASPMMQHQQSSAGRLLMLEEEDQLPESVLPYTNLMGSQASLHDLAG